jgi:hypothetical protein
MQPFRQIPGDAIEQKCRSTKPQRPRLPRPQQGAVEQSGRAGIFAAFSHARLVRRPLHIWQSAALVRPAQVVAKSRGESLALHLRRESK